MLVAQGYAPITRLPLPAPSDIAVTGLCFQPKALIVFIPDGGTPGAYGSAGGFRPPAVRFYNSFVGQFGSDWGQRSVWDSGSVNYQEQDGFNVGFGSISATLVSYDPDGFTLHFPTIGFNPFYWIAFGGDLLETHAGTYQTPVAPSTSPVVVTGVGFQPDFLFVMTQQDDGAVSASVCQGMASGPSDQASVAACMGVFGSAFHTLLNGYLTCPIDNSGGNTNLTQLGSFDTDGFTVNVASNTASDTNRNVRYLAMKDPTSAFKVGVETQNTSTGTKATTGSGFRPGAGVFIGSFKTVDNDFTYAASPDGTPMMSIGAVDGLLRQSCETEFNQPGGFGGHDQNSFSDNGIVLAVGQATPLQLNGAATLDTWDADGFTLDWTTSDGIARFFVYGVMKTTDVDPCDTFMPIIYRWLKR